MRKLMICASVALAMFQLWPMVFGRARADVAQTVASVAPKTVVAVANGTDLPRIVPVSTAPVPAPRSCYRQYQAHFAACPASDQMCHVKAADDWDLCEATGFWPQ